MTKGKCDYCSQVISGTAMDKHLFTCSKSPYTTTKQRQHSEHRQNRGRAHDGIFLIGICATELPLYWMFIEANGSTTLEILDKFLRKTWLECCGHMSHFVIRNARYERYHTDDDFGDAENKTMKVPIGKILSLGDVFHHEYDYGTTTYLQLKVFAVRRGTVASRLFL